ncbi:MAG: hypothetical protein AAB316_02510 [Bacteroidota bacterium]
MTVLFFLFGIFAMFLLDRLFSLSLPNKKTEEPVNSKKNKRKKKPQPEARPVLSEQGRAVAHTFLFVLLLLAIILFHNLPWLKSQAASQPFEAAKTEQLTEP